MRSTTPPPMYIPLSFHLRYTRLRAQASVPVRSECDTQAPKPGALALGTTATASTSRPSSSVLVAIFPAALRSADARRTTP